MNQVQLLGNLTRAPQMRSTQTGRSVASFSIACHDDYIDNTGAKKERTAFINCVAWGVQADKVATFQQGDRVFACGRIATRTYEKDGRKVYVTEVVCDVVAKDLKAPASQPTNAPSNFDNFAQDNYPQEEIPF